MYQITNQMNHTNLSTSGQWSLPKKLLFRFFFVLCTITIVPILSNLFWSPVITWAGKYFYNEAVTQHPSGSGDTLYDFYDITIKIVIAVIAALVWSIIDRKRTGYNKLLYWQEVYIRYYLAFFLFVYGFMKVIKLQFAQPGLTELLIPLGHKSPMGLAWTFMGFSDSYTIFSGFCEALAGAFLIYRKTRTLGALIGFGVMLNVFLMNMSYDIPVKLFSFQLAALCAFLIALDYRRLLNVFILNRPVQPQASMNLFKDKRANLATQIVKGIAIVAGLGLLISNNLQSRVLYGDNAPKSPVHGIYEVEKYIVNNDTIASVMTDTLRWRYLVLERDNANIFNMKTTGYDRMKFFIIKTDTVKKEVAFLNYSDSTQTGKLTYRKADKNRFVFKGIFDNDTLELHTVKTDEKDYTLMNRGFNWVSEYPYNR